MDILVTHEKQRVWLDVWLVHWNKSLEQKKNKKVTRQLQNLRIKTLATARKMFTPVAVSSRINNNADTLQNECLHIVMSVWQWRLLPSCFAKINILVQCRLKAYKHCLCPQRNSWIIKQQKKKTMTDSSIRSKFSLAVFLKADADQCCKKKFAVIKTIIQGDYS